MVGAGRLNQIDHVLHDDVGDEHVLERLLHAQDLGAGHDGADLDVVLAPPAPPLEDLPLLVGVRVADRHADQEPVELCFRQRIRALELDRVLRRDDQEGRIEPERLSFHGHLRLLHCLQQRGLGLGRRPVDLVDQQEVREHRPRAKLELGLALIEQEAPGDVGGQQIGRALQALEGQVQRLREQARDQGLGEARIVFDQHVAVREDTGEDALEDVALADDDAGQCVEDLAAALGDPTDLHRRGSSEAMSRPSAASAGPRPNERPGGLSSAFVDAPPARESSTSFGQSMWSK